jgi:hypothetical protein
MDRPRRDGLSHGRLRGRAGFDTTADDVDPAPAEALTGDGVRPAADALPAATVGAALYAVSRPEHVAVEVFIRPVDQTW